MRRGFFFIMLIWVGVSTNSQPSALQMPRRDKIDIPFEFEGKFIIVNVTFERFFPMRFIFDTGAEHTILTKREIADVLRLPFDRKISIMGADMQTELYADIARRVRVDLPGVEMLQDILVLGEDYFHLDEVLGEQIHGILGASVFRNYVVRINYNQQVITLYNPEAFKEPSRKYTRYPIKIDRNKPYVRSTVQLGGASPIEVNLLLDTGAGLPLMLYTHTVPGLEMPANAVKANIGRGLGGYLEGYLGRVGAFDFCDYPFQNLLANFQEVPHTADSSVYSGKQGIIGNDILSRFNLIIDFPGSKLYLQPNRQFKAEYSYDKSGLTLIATGQHFNKILVQFVLEGSPAAEAGVLAGDELISINGKPVSLLRLNGTLVKLQGKQGKTIQVRLRRDGKKHSLKFALRELI